MVFPQLVWDAMAQPIRFQPDGFDARIFVIALPCGFDFVVLVFDPEKVARYNRVRTEFGSDTHFISIHSKFTFGLFICFSGQMICSCRTIVIVYRVVLEKKNPWRIGDLSKIITLTFSNFRNPWQPGIHFTKSSYRIPYSCTKFIRLKFSENWTFTPLAPHGLEFATRSPWVFLLTQNWGTLNSAQTAKLEQ